MYSQENGIPEQNPKRKAQSSHRQARRRRRPRKSNRPTCAGSIAKAFLGLAVFQLVVIVLFLPLLYGTSQPSSTAQSSLSPATSQDDDDSSSSSSSKINYSRRIRGSPSSSSSSWTPTINKNKTIDDYMTRHHVTNASLSDADADADSDLPILVVGGSDGSGTRAFVDMLGRLGVPMVIDDTGTLDVHAGCIFDKAGWPALVRVVLAETKRANYSWEDLPVVQQAMLQTQMEALVKHYGQRGESLRRHGISQGFKVASNVRYGLKAPVSMLVLPILRQAFQRIKFLHVVRDGRDVSLSKNKSPVKKFYHVFYDDAKERQENFEAVDGDIVFQQAMAMQLWNDWNTQVLDWERRNSDGKTFDYLVMRTEDLMDPRTRLTSLKQLADFVGSNKNENELCCLSKETIMDMGKSGVKPSAPRTFARKRQTWGQWLFGLLPVGLQQVFVKCIWGYRQIRVLFGLEPPFHRPLDPADWGMEEYGESLAKRQGSTEALTDEQDLPMPDTTSALDRERRSFGESEIKERKAKLLSKIQERRDRRQHGRRLLDLRQVEDNDGKEEQPPHQSQYKDKFRNAVHRFKTEHVPFRNETTHHPHLDHVKFDTMLERLKELEDQQHLAQIQRTPFLLKRASRMSEKKGFGSFWESREDRLQQVLKPPDAEREESPEQVMQRYGKWRKEVEERPELNRVLHQEGKHGLETFGYDPRAWFSDFPRQENPDTMTCQPTHPCPLIPKPASDQNGYNLAS